MSDTSPGEYTPVPPPEPQTWLRVVAGVVVNVEAHAEQPAAEDGVTWAQHPGAGIGWAFDGTNWLPPAPPAPVVPVTVTALQAKLELNARGLYDAATQAVANAAATNKAVLIFWNFAPEWRRADPNVAAIGAALGLSPAQIDAMFIEASTL